MVALPRNLEDPIRLADWLELTALEAGDRNASAGDLTTALQIATNVTDDIVQQVMLELEYRQKAADEAYPFRVQRARVLQFRGGWRNFIPYIFCLILSYFGSPSSSEGDPDPRQLFEELSASAATEYIRGSVLHFGIACARGTAPFENAVRDLCLKLGEGTGFHRRTARRVKDDKLDIVAWKPFADGLPSQLVMFGQCASGENWQDKMGELNPDAFCRLWLIDQPVSPVVRSFYIPHRVSREDWSHPSAYSGILFDRCRVAFWAQKARGRITDDRYINWCRSVMSRLP
jgi:hypothetical protein